MQSVGVQRLKYHKNYGNLGIAKCRAEDPEHCNDGIETAVPSQ